jgi:hypothetical protein
MRHPLVNHGKRNLTRINNRKHGRLRHRAVFDYSTACVGSAAIDVNRYIALHRVRSSLACVRQPKFDSYCSCFAQNSRVTPLGFEKRLQGLRFYGCCMRTAGFPKISRFASVDDDCSRFITGKWTSNCTSTTIIRL